MAGIYLHIPFCKQACTYCNFHFSTSLRYKEELVEAMVQEAILRKYYLEDDTIETIYFGGGTPSLLSEAELNIILNTLRKEYTVSPNAELTLEANPDDLTAGKLTSWKASGINRLSIGVQSFFEEELRWMNRAHNATEAIEGLKLATQFFDNITLDLIYGSPLLTDEMWKQNVDIATSLNIAHLSCYALTVEEQTPLHKKLLQEKTENVDADRQARQFLLLMQWLREKGYEHYEVSNFAKQGYRSRHNSSYWKGVSYLGLGPSAHSYNGVERSWNVANNNKYIRDIKNHDLLQEAEVLTPTQKLNEYLMISLRTIEGIDLRHVADSFGADETTRIRHEIKKYEEAGKVKLVGSFIQLTDEGMLLADGIAAELFSVEEQR